MSPRPIGNKFDNYRRRPFKNLCSAPPETTKKELNAIQAVLAETQRITEFQSSQKI